MVNSDQKVGVGVKFDRIRRITGYLVGTIDRWNDGKTAEEKDRVKHGMPKNCLPCDKKKRKKIERNRK